MHGISTIIKVNERAYQRDLFRRIQAEIRKEGVDNVNAVELAKSFGVGVDVIRQAARAG